MPRRLPEKARRVGRPRGARGRRYYPKSLFRSAPVREGDELEVLIDDIGSRGDGIARIRDFLIFVPQARVGERLRVRVLQVREKFAIAEKLKSKEG